MADLVIGPCATQQWVKIWTSYNVQPELVFHHGSTPVHQDLMQHVICEAPLPAVLHVADFIFILIQYESRLRHVNCSRSCA